jgi:hypothetical protein
MSLSNHVSAASLSKTSAVVQCLLQQYSMYSGFEPETFFSSQDSRYSELLTIRNVISRSAAPSSLGHQKRNIWFLRCIKDSTLTAEVRLACVLHLWNANKCTAETVECSVAEWRFGKSKIFHSDLAFPFYNLWNFLLYFSCGKYHHLDEHHSVYIRTLLHMLWGGMDPFMKSFLWNVGDLFSDSYLCYTWVQRCLELSWVQF